MSKEMYSVVETIGHDANETFERSLRAQPSNESFEQDQHYDSELPQEAPEHTD